LTDPVRPNRRDLAGAAFLRRPGMRGSPPTIPAATLLRSGGPPNIHDMVARPDTVFLRPLGT
jgi:hypothetical protein